MSGLDLEPDNEPDFDADVRLLAAAIGLILVVTFALAASGLCRGQPL